MGKHWDYATAPGSSHGLMVCTACHKPIAEGQYRVRETEAAYLPQHRACSALDPQWSKLDAEARTWDTKERRRREQYAAFVAEFGAPHDLIEENHF